MIVLASKAVDYYISATQGLKLNCYFVNYQDQKCWPESQSS